jgi:hypothetical protein
MPKHVTKMLFLMAALAVAPANAGQSIGAGARHDAGEPACPHERARMAALARGEARQAPKAATRVTLVAGVPGERPLRNVAPGAYFIP